MPLWRDKNIMLKWFDLGPSNSSGESSTVRGWRNNGPIPFHLTSRRSVFLAIIKRFGYFEFPLGMVSFTAETGRKYRLTAPGELGLRN